MLAISILSLCAPAQDAAAARAADLRIEHALTCRPDGCWEVRVHGSGLDPGAGPLEFMLNDWGEWRAVDAYYFEVIAADPPLAADATGFPPFATAIAPPDGIFDLTYELRVADLDSEAHRNHGLLPFRTQSYAYGHTRNVFLEVRQAGATVAAEYTVELLPPEGADVFSGWAGRHAGPQRAGVDPAACNGIFAFGSASTERILGSGADQIMVWHFGAARDVSDTVGVMVEMLAPAMGAALESPAPSPLRVFVTDAGGGGMSSDHGFFVGYEASTPDFVEHSTYFHQTIAHELFHTWLGIRVPGNEDIVWFHEGFTDYFALWFLAATGGCERRWFAERVLELDAEARATSSLGSISFADPDTAWRDGDGPNERMAYQGGLLLALALDVELRAAGKPGALQIVKDFLQDGVAPDLASVRGWIESQGLKEFYARCVAGAGPPAAQEGLERLGFVFERASVPLTYLGLCAEGVGLGARIVKVDPNGPAAAAGVRVGDVVGGYAPTRDGAVEIGSAVTTEYRFGLALFEPAAKSVQIWFERDGREVEIRIVPQIWDGGSRRVIGNAGEALDDFFRFES